MPLEINFHGRNNMKKLFVFCVLALAQAAVAHEDTTCDITCENLAACLKSCCSREERLARINCALEKGLSKEAIEQMLAAMCECGELSEETRSELCADLENC